MALDAGNKIVNTNTGLVADGKDISGGYFAIDSLANIPNYSKVNGALCYVTNENKFYRYNGSAWIEESFGGGAVWGSITGTLANQTDLQNALNDKQDELSSANEGQNITIGSGGVINALSGLTATVAELNYVDGVTSAIQTQIDNKSTVSAATTGTSTTEAKYLTIDSTEYKLAGGTELPSTVNDRYLHTNSSTGNLEWSEVKDEIVISPTQPTDPTNNLWLDTSASSSYTWPEIIGYAGPTNAGVVKAVTKTSEMTQQVGIDGSTGFLYTTPGGSGSSNVDDVRINDSSIVVNKIANISVVDNLSSTSTTSTLSANMGKNLQDQIHNLENIGRFLSIWNASTGAPTSEPITSPYSFKVGDYYRVGVAGTKNPANNSTYTTGGTNWVEGSSLGVGDVVYVSNINGATATWVKQTSGGGGTVQDVQIDGTSLINAQTGIANIVLDSNSLQYVNSVLSTKQLIKVREIS